MENLVVCEHICKSFGRKKVLDDFSINIERGKIIGLLGPNGNGKTTLIKILAGLLKADSGNVTINGSNVSIDTKNIISYLPERTYLSPSQKVSDVLTFFNDFYSDFDTEKAKAMLEKLNIDINSKISTLSKGTREKVQLALVMSRNAQLYILDEPMGGVDPAARDFIIKTILSDYNENSSIIISTHLISDIENILDDVIFLKDGKISLYASADELRETHKKSVDALFREVFVC